MAINYPASPGLNEVFTVGNTTWQWDGTAWNVTSSAAGANIFATIQGDTGQTTADGVADTLTLAGGTNIATSVVDDIVTFNFTGEAGGGAGDVFKNIVSDDGTAVASGEDDTLNILGGTNISTEISTDTSNLTVNMDAFGIDFLSDVDTSSSVPTSGQVLKWNGTNWAPGADATSGGGGTDADTLDGFDSTYFLDYNNFSNTPAIATLTDFSVGNELTASGNGAIGYDNTTGVFRYTPPTAAGIGALVSVAIDNITDIAITSVGDNDLLAYDNASSSWINQTPVEAGFATVATSGLYTDLSSTPTIPTDLGDLTDTGSIIPADLTDLGIADGSNNQVLGTDGFGNFTFRTVSAGGATQNLFETVSGDTGSTTANSATDTLTVAGGAGITTAVSGDTITVSYNGASGVTDFDQLGDAQTANLATIDEFVVRSGMHFEVDNIGATAYTFNPLYTGSNPSIFVISGMQISFKLNVGGHPFEILDGTLTPITTNLLHIAEDGTPRADTSAQAQDGGTLIWSIPESTSGTFAYQCTLHPAMVGSITVKRLSSL